MAGRMTMGGALGLRSTPSSFKSTVVSRFQIPNSKFPTGLPPPGNLVTSTPIGGPSVPTTLSTEPALIAKSTGPPQSST
jgi:hypothetical protein